MEQLTDKLLSPIENKIHDFNKKAAGAGWNAFKRLLGTAADPFFRAGMGERYSPNNISGVTIWGVATVLACAVPPLRSIMPPLCECVHLYRIGSFFSWVIFPIISGAALIYFNFKFGIENVALIQKYRVAGTPYHTMSRGTPRWGNANVLVGLGITVGLLIFNLPAGVLFAAACVMSNKLADEQQAAIYSRYLDALDQRVEQEYMESAILGKCPTEITYLCKPLDANMDQDLRNNIAAAAVGKPVKILSKSPNQQS